MKKILELEVELDENGVCQEQVFDEDDNDKLLFSVYNLNEYPEDAIISRDLFSASQLRLDMVLNWQNKDTMKLNM